MSAHVASNPPPSPTVVMTLPMSGQVPVVVPAYPSIAAGAHIHHQLAAGAMAHPLAQRLPKFSMRQLFFHDLSQCLFDFVIQLLPTAEEMAIKEDVRRLLEKLIKTIEPESRLLSFGSTANGFSLRNSDMDLCCLLDSKGPQLQASDLVTMLGDLLERETKFHVKTLPFARIPIVKLSLDPSPGLPFGISCDIGFENRLALENTRLLLSYASVDPTRVRTMVLFLKVWTKRRKINSPYRGTLSSYGYVLLVIYFLVHVKNPPVLPNLQSMPPLRPISHEDMHIGENNIWFFDDIELLRQKWQSSNLETVAELLVDFFKYYSKEFSYNTDVVSIRAGFMTRESKGWQTEPDARDSARERNRFCIEDPFETGYNVARTVTKDGLYTIRGEFMRASRILSKPQDRALVALAQLCEERGDELVQASAQYTSNSASTGLSASNSASGATTPITTDGAPVAGGIPRLPPLPPQVPYTVSSSQHAPAFIPIAVPDARTPPRRLFEPLAATAAASSSPPVDASLPSGGAAMAIPSASGVLVAGSASEPTGVNGANITPVASTAKTTAIVVPIPVFPPRHERKTSAELVEGTTPLLQHMAPTRSKWTSPPPPDAPEADQDSYRNNLGLSLSLATSSTPARETIHTKERSPSSSSNASDASTNEEDQELMMTTNSSGASSGGSQPPSPFSGSEPGGVAKHQSHPKHLQIGKGTEMERDGNSISTPKASELTHGRGRVHGQRGREPQRGNAGSTEISSSTPKDLPFLPRPPTLPDAPPRRSSSGPPSLRSPPPPDHDSSAAVEEGKTPTAATSSGSTEARQAQLTVDTQFQQAASSSSSSASTSHYQPQAVPIHPQPRSAWPEFTSHPYLPPTHQQRNRTNTQSRHHHSASSGSSSSHPITLYRSQPQATTFPLYQQVSPSNTATVVLPPTHGPSSSSSPSSSSPLMGVSSYIGPPTYEPVQIKSVGSPFMSGSPPMNGSPSSKPNATLPGQSNAASPRLSPYSPRLLSSPRSPAHIPMPASASTSGTPSPVRSSASITANPVASPRSPLPPTLDPITSTSPTPTPVSVPTRPVASGTTSPNGSATPTQAHTPTPPSSTTPLSSSNTKRTGSLIRKKYDPSATFRIPTTMTIPVKPVSTVPAEGGDAIAGLATSEAVKGIGHDTLFDRPTGHERVHADRGANGDGLASTKMERRGTDASLASSGSATSGGTDVPEARVVWS